MNRFFIQRGTQGISFVDAYDFRITVRVDTGICNDHLIPDETYYETGRRFKSTASLSKQ